MNFEDRGLLDRKACFRDPQAGHLRTKFFDGSNLIFETDQEGPSTEEGLNSMACVF